MQKVLVIVGPTGVGKTKWSVALAKRYNGEIISGDAYQCYQEMSIGSAKIKEEEKQAIPHHLIDVVSIEEEYNVKIFQEKARACIHDIIQRGKVPIICGGTGLYIKSLLYDYHFEKEEVDQVYEQHLVNKNNDELYQMLITIDEEATKTIHPNNRQRVIRALMMAHAGSKKSERIQRQEHKLLYDAYIIGLTMDREQLYERINERVLQMMDEGLLDEITFIAHKRKDVFTLQSMQGIGYKEWKPYFEKQATQEEIIQLIQKNSRNFAKRQYTWFRNQLPVHWVDIQKDEIKFEEIDKFLGDHNEV